MNDICAQCHDMNDYPTYKTIKVPFDQLDTELNAYAKEGYILDTITPVGTQTIVSDKGIEHVDMLLVTMEYRHD